MTRSVASLDSLQRPRRRTWIAYLDVRNHQHHEAGHTLHDSLPLLEEDVPSAKPDSRISRCRTLPTDRDLTGPDLTKAARRPLATQTATASSRSCHPCSNDGDATAIIRDRARDLIKVAPRDGDRRLGEMPRTPRVRHWRERPGNLSSIFASEWPYLKSSSYGTISANLSCHTSPYNVPDDWRQGIRTLMDEVGDPMSWTDLLPDARAQKSPVGRSCRYGLYTSSAAVTCQWISYLEAACNRLYSVCITSTLLRHLQAKPVQDYGYCNSSDVAKSICPKA